MGMEKKDPYMNQSGNVRFRWVFWTSAHLMRWNFYFWQHFYGMFPRISGIAPGLLFGLCKEGATCILPKGWTIHQYRRLEDQRQKKHQLWDLCMKFIGGASLLSGGNSNISFIFIPKLGEDEPILTIIFFRWVGSTTNQLLISYPKISLAFWDLLPSC